MERQWNYGISGGNGRSGRVSGGREGADPGGAGESVRESGDMAVFWDKGEMFFSTCVHEKEFLSFLKLGKCLDFLYESKEEWDRPVILSDPLGMVWLAESAYVQDEGEERNKRTSRTAEEGREC